MDGRRIYWIPIARKTFWTMRKESTKNASHSILQQLEILVPEFFVFELLVATDEKPHALRLHEIRQRIPDKLADRMRRFDIAKTGDSRLNSAIQAKNRRNWRNKNVSYRHCLIAYIVVATIFFGILAILFSLLDKSGNNSHRIAGNLGRLDFARGGNPCQGDRP